jgi:sec-independent protein translocase protein TatA
MIPGIPTMGGVELLIILAIILLFFGAKRLPELARSLGRGKREFQQGIEEGEGAAEAQRQPAKAEASERGETSEATLRKEAPSTQATEEAGAQEEYGGSRAERSPR